MIFSYGVVSSSSTNGACNLVTIPPETLSPPFSVLTQLEPTNLGYNVASSFIGYLGLLNCGFEEVSPANPPQVITEVVYSSNSPSSPILLSSSSTLPLSSTLPSSSSSPSNALSSPIVRETPSSPHTKIRTALSIIFSTISAIVITFGILAWLRYRKRKLAAANAMDKSSAVSREEEHPYLQKKSELDDDGTRIYELHNTHSRVAGEEPQPHPQQKNELEGDERRIHELQTLSNMYEI